MTQGDDWRRAATAEQLRNVVRTIDPSVAHIARIQDYWLGGRDHFEADRTAGGKCSYIDADIREPDKILADAAEVIDFTRPVAVVLMAVLQFVPDADDPYGLVRRLMAAVPGGSYLVISHPASDIQAAAMAGMATRLNALMAQQVKPRGKAEVTAFFDGLDLVEPGVIRCPEWRPDRPEDAAGKSTMWGGVAEKPASA